MMAYSVTFWLFVQHAKGDICFVRYADLPFVPYPGLDIHDDAVGQFRLDEVAWDADEQMFFCQANWTLWADKSLRTVRKHMKAGDWEEEKIVNEEEV
ncbi:MAG: hypothetical protein WCL32_07415 [Planctomycetota bacterium]